jgi:spore germination cell wall hydrolase CwlJ-like protein
MFKSLLVACAAITLAAHIIGLNITPSAPAYAATPVLVYQEIIEPEEITFVSIEPATPIYSDEDLDCMTKNIYFEARDQSIEGQYAVAEVVMNRLAAEEFPKTVCEVIKQKNPRVCQFSWYCDGLSDVMYDKGAVRRARLIARSALSFKTDFTNGSKYYHAYYVSPKWSKTGKVKQIQDHIFYTHI